LSKLKINVLAPSRESRDPKFHQPATAVPYRGNIVG